MSSTKSKNKNHTSDVEAKKSALRELTGQKEISNMSDLFASLKTEDDITIFVKSIEAVFCQDSFEKKILKESLQLLWILVSYIRQSCLEEDQSIDSMIKLLDIACVPAESIDLDNTFDIMVKDCSDEKIKNHYAYFKQRVFGTYSNYYKKVVHQCLEILNDISHDKIVEQFNVDYPVCIHREDKDSLFGYLCNSKGQDLQVELFHKRRTAIHEASHAVASYLLGVDFVGATIVSFDSFYGFVQRDTSIQVEPSKSAMISYAGLIGEEVVLDPLFWDVYGGRFDTKHATEVIRDDVIAKLNDPFQAQQYIFIDADVLGLTGDVSPYIAYETIKRCVELRQASYDLIKANKALVEALAAELLKKQSMASEEVIAFLDGIFESTKE